MYPEPDFQNMIEKSKKCRTLEKLLEVAERQLDLINCENDYELMALHTEIKERAEHYEKLSVFQNERRIKMELKVASLKSRIAVLKEQIDVLKEQMGMRIERIDVPKEQSDVPKEQSDECNEQICIKERCFCCIS